MQVVTGRLELSPIEILTKIIQKMKTLLMKTSGLKNNYHMKQK